MNKKQTVFMIVFCALLALLFVGALAGTAALLLLGNTQGLVGELLGNVNVSPLFEKLPTETEMPFAPESQHPETQVPDETDNVLDVYPLPLETIPDVNLEPVPDEVVTLPEEMQDFFDFNMVHTPSYQGSTRIHQGMRLAIVINMMGKPHRYIHLTDESVVLLWKTDSEKDVTVYVEFQPGEYETEEDRWNNARVTDVSR